MMSHNITSSTDDYAKTQQKSDSIGEYYLKTGKKKSIQQIVWQLTVSLKTNHFGDGHESNPISQLIPTQHMNHLGEHHHFDIFFLINFILIFIFIFL